MIVQFRLFHVKAELISDKNMYNLPHFRTGLRMQSQLQNAPMVYKVEQSISITITILSRATKGKVTPN